MTSTIPASIDHLVAACASAASGVQVIDGQPTNVEDDYIAVGFTQNPDSSAVTLTQSRFTAGYARELESYDILCSVSSWNGDSDQKVARDRMFELLAIVEGVVAADRKLGGGALDARVDTGDLIQGIAGAGVVATMPFAVHVEAQK